MPRRGNSPPHIRVFEGVIRWFATLLGLAAVVVGIVLVSNDTGPPQEVPVDPSSVYDPIVAGEDFPGGIHWIVSRDGIRPVYGPEHIAAEASPLASDDLVIGVSIGSEARAYPVGLLAVREMVNDWVDDVPIVVSWCPLCGTGTVHRREIDGEPVLFGNQGALWGNAMTWWDHDTGSIWSQPLGEAIAGLYEGRRLELLPSTLTTWEAWRTAHPGTLILDGPIFPSGPNDEGVAVVVSFGAEAAAYPLELVKDRGVINDEVGGVAVAIVSDPDGLWSVFSPEVDKQVLTLEWVDGQLRDLETETTWHPVTGTGLEGELGGSTLGRLPASTVFPADFFTFWPEGRLVEG